MVTIQKMSPRSIIGKLGFMDVKSTDNNVILEATTINKAPSLFA